MKNNPYDNNLDSLAIEQCQRLFGTPGERGTHQWNAIASIATALVASATFQLVEQARQLDRHPNNPRNSGDGDSPVTGS